MSKYGNRKPTYKGIKFDSSLEMCRYIYLSSEEKKGHISNLRRQVRYQILPAQYEKPEYITDPKKKPKLKEHAAHYTADFVYNWKGREIVEDTKGVRTEAYILRRKMMLYVHDIDIYEVHTAAAPLGMSIPVAPLINEEDEK